MFGSDDLKRLVECAGRALECEDRYLTRCAHERAWKKLPPGIYANINERYYQFVVWRALLPSFPWRPHPERTRKKYDLAFYKEESDELVAVAEMKVLYRCGDPRVREVQSDVAKLRGASVPGVMLVMLGLQEQKNEDALQWLAEKVEIKRQDFVTHFFDTLPYPNEPPPYNFVVVGFFVPKKAVAPS